MLAPVAERSSMPGTKSERRAQPSLMYAVKQVEQAVRAHLDAALRPAGITALQFTALTVLDRSHEMSVADLARNAFVRPQSMADLVTALEVQGLVERRPDPHNRRRVSITLSENGRSMVDLGHELTEGIEEKMLADLTPRQADQLRKSLDKCRRALST
jgi:DNA-binding MarR family transcriptional regulator